MTIPRYLRPPRPGGPGGHRRRLRRPGAPKEEVPSPRMRLGGEEVRTARHRWRLQAFLFPRRLPVFETVSGMVLDKLGLLPGTYKGVHPPNSPWLQVLCYPYSKTSFAG